MIVSKKSNEIHSNQRANVEVDNIVNDNTDCDSGNYVKELTKPK